MRKVILITSALIVPLLLSAQYIARYELSSSALLSNFQFYKIHFDEHGQREEIDLSIMKATTYIFYQAEADDSVFVLLKTMLDSKKEKEAGYFRSTVKEFFQCNNSTIRSVKDTLGYDLVLFRKDTNGSTTSLSVKFHDSPHRVRSLLCIPTRKMPLIHYAIMKTERGTIRLQMVDLSETDEKVKLPKLSKIGKEISYDTWCHIKKHEGGFGGF